MTIFKKIRRRLKKLNHIRRKTHTCKQHTQCIDTLSLAEYQVNAVGQRLQTGDRSEMCSNSMNNNQRLAILRMIQDTREQ